MKREEKEKLFKLFLADNEIIIADKSSASRRRLVKTIVDMGAKRNQIHSVAHYSEAIAIIESNKPKLILSDYKLSGGSGFELFKHYKETYPEEKKAILILVTSNISQSAVAKAAEEDVDSFIIKPYTVKSLEKSLKGSVIAKLFPSKYIQAIELGKEQLFAGNFKEALEIFDDAKALSDAPSLALFYHGQTKYFMDDVREAEHDYKEGLKINNIHYKCQIGLYEMFKLEGKETEAYDVVKNIARYFPSNPERLKEVIHLAVRTKNYADIEQYYDLFVDLEERPRDVIKYVCAGMYVCGKYHFLQKNKDKARSIFERSAIAAAGEGKFLSAMVISLVENNCNDDAKNIVGRFDFEDRKSTDYIISNYLAFFNEMPLNVRVSNGLEIINQGHKNPLVMRYLIDSLIEADALKKADQYMDEANHLWPDLFPLSRFKKSA